MLFHHPVEETFTRLATRGLKDSSEWVRLAAAGLLTAKGIDSGEAILLGGLRHKRWEIRWWCAASLTRIRRATHLDALKAQQDSETDRWLESELGSMIKTLESIDSN